MQSEHDHLLSKFTRQVNKINRLCDKISKLPKGTDQKKARSELIKAVIEIKSTLKDLEELKRIKLPFRKRVYEKGKELLYKVTKVFVHHYEYEALIGIWNQLF